MIKTTAKGMELHTTYHGHAKIIAVHGDDGTWHLTVEGDLVTFYGDTGIIDLGIEEDEFYDFLSQLAHNIETGVFR